MKAVVISAILTIVGPTITWAQTEANNGRSFRFPDAGSIGERLRTYREAYAQALDEMQREHSASWRGTPVARFRPRSHTCFDDETYMPRAL